MTEWTQFFWLLKKTQSMTEKQTQVHSQSLPLTMDVSKLWKHCYRITHAFFHTA